MSDITNLTSPPAGVSHANASAVSPPLGVRIGAGSDPRLLGLMAFALGTLIVGMSTVGEFPTGVMGGVVPVAFFCAGFALAAACVWAFILGASFLAGTFGIVAGFFSSLAALLLGLAHNWFALPASSVGSVEEIFYIVWCCFFLALLLPACRLPAIYPLAVALLVTYLALSATSTYTGTGPGNVTTAAGSAILAASFLLFWGYVASALNDMRARLSLPEGPELLAARDD